MVYRETQSAQPMIGTLQLLPTQFPMPHQSRASSRRAMCGRQTAEQPDVLLLDPDRVHTAEGEIMEALQIVWDAERDQPLFNACRTPSTAARLLMEQSEQPKHNPPPTAEMPRARRVIQRAGAAACLLLPGPGSPG
jgi:hypothetical protein